MPVALSFIQSAIKVAPLGKNLYIDLKWRNNPCGKGKVIIPDNDILRGIPYTDAVLYVSALEEQNEDYLSFASFCPCPANGPLNKRPTVLTITFNLPMVVRDVLTTNWYNWIDTTIHEITHSLVFSPDHFINFGAPYRDAFQK